MARGIIQHISELLKDNNTDVLLIENNDKFLYRDDVIGALQKYGIEVFIGSSVEQRIQFELKKTETILVLLSQDNDQYLEDIQSNSVSMEFKLDSIFPCYHIPSLLDQDISLLDKILLRKQIIPLTKLETLEVIEKVKNVEESSLKIDFNLAEFISKLESELALEPKNWKGICRVISNGVLGAIDTPDFDTVLKHVNRVNDKFQEHISLNYQQTKNSSSVKGPKIVSKILDYLSFNYLEDKIALIVIDGLAYWQYELLKGKLPNRKNEDVIYSWIPSITQLSRQAIFRGDNPQVDYRQGPVNEERLWFSYWKAKGLNQFEVKYNHENSDLSNIQNVSKFALVFKDLDDKMHSSSDLSDLLDLTENWIERSNIISLINELKKAGFKVFLTTDHGNIQAKGWRGLNGREKLGTNKSGSKSQRHIEYSDEWLFDEFITNNPELTNSIVMEGQAIYFSSDLSFSNESKLVTHGGAHILEVLIPFIEFENE
jgi:biotin operon repressor